MKKLVSKDIEFNIVLGERKGIHIHFLLIPKYEWMYDISNDIIGNSRKILEYSKNTFKNYDIFNRINEISNLLRGGLNE